MVKRPTAVDLFAGCGGLTEGLKLGGFRVVGAIECDALAAETYRLNHPEVVMWESDIRAVRPADVVSALGLRPGELDLLAGCPPCQGFSTLRTLNGNRTVNDERNDLISEFGRFASEMLPRRVMLENVPALFEDELFRILLRELSALGYSLRSKVLDVADYAVPQRRRRLVMIGSRNGPMRFAPKARRRKTVREAIGHLQQPGRSADTLHDRQERRSERVQRLIAAVPIDGGSRKDLPAEFILNCHRQNVGFRDVYGRMAWDSVAPTLTTGCYNPSKGRFLHPTQNRAITMREASLLQTFRGDYLFPEGAGPSQIARLLGNALPPEFVRRQALALRRN